jgi:hypothetical protein
MSEMRIIETGTASKVFRGQTALNCTVYINDHCNDKRRAADVYQRQ